MLYQLLNKFSIPVIETLIDHQRIHGPHWYIQVYVQLCVYRGYIYMCVSMYMCVYMYILLKCLYFYICVIIRGIIIELLASFLNRLDT